MNAPSEDIKDMLLAESSLALTFATDLFMAQEPAVDDTISDNVVTVLDICSFPTAALLSSNENDTHYEYKVVQIRVRNRSYTDGWELIQNIHDLLHGRAQETWNGTLYTAIYAASSPEMLEWDRNGNAIFFTNLNLQRR